MAMHPSRIGLSLLLIAFSLGGCNGDLTEKPVRSGAPSTLDTKSSTIGAYVTLQNAQLAQLISQHIPPLSDSGNGDDVCVLGGRVCAGTNFSYAGNIGGIAISAADESTIRLDVPVSFTGQGGFRGEISRLIRADRKNFSGALVLHTDLSLMLGADWCPKLNANVSYTWTSNPRVEIVSGVWVDVKDQVEKKLSEHLPALVDQAKNAINCDEVRGELAKVYGVHTFPVDIPAIGAMHLNLTPTAFGFSGIHASPDTITLALTMGANVELSSVAAVPATLALPAPTTIPPTTPRMTVALPVRTSYETLSAVTSQMLASQTFEKDTPAGKVLVKVKSVELYPSNGQLVAGLNINADLPSSMFDTSGTVYVLGTPTVTDGTKVSLASPAFSTSLDNELWTATASLFQGPILTKLNEIGIYDLSEQINNAKDALMTKLADPNLIPGMKLQASDVSMLLGRVAVADKTLDVEGLFGAGLKLSLAQ